MKFYRLIVLLLILITGCCEDEIVASYRMSAFEQTLIPYTSFQKISFIDNEGNTFIANSQPKETTIDLDRAGPESCRLTEVQQESNFLSFGSKDLRFEILLYVSHYTDFYMYKRNITNNTNAGRFDIFCEGIFDLTIEERLTDVTIEEFDFQNILIFENCSDGTDVQRVIYSPDRGIEFIEFKNGNWFKLVV